MAKRYHGQGFAWFFWYLLAFAALVCSLPFIVPRADAQTVSGSLRLNWTLPTTGCTTGVTPCDNRPLTGAGALDGVLVWISTSPIVPDPLVNNGLPTAAPTLTLAGSAATATHTMQVTAGQTLYARIAVRNASSTSALSAQLTKVIDLPIVPGVPTNVTIQLTIGTAP